MEINSYYKEENVIDNLNISNENHINKDNTKNQEILSIIDEKEKILRANEEKINTEITINNIQQDNLTSILMPNNSIEGVKFTENFENIRKNTDDYQIYNRGSKLVLLIIASNIYILNFKLINRTIF